MGDRHAVPTNDETASRSTSPAPSPQSQQDSATADAAEPDFDPPTCSSIRVRNVTRERLLIEYGDRNRLALAPLEHRKIIPKDGRYERSLLDELALWQRYGLVRVERVEIIFTRATEPSKHLENAVLLGCGSTLLLAVALLIGFWSSLAGHLWPFVVILALALPTLLAAASRVLKWIIQSRQGRADRVSWLSNLVRRIPRWIVERVATNSAIAIAIGVPATALMLQGRLLRHGDGGWYWELDAALILRATLAISATVGPALLFFIRATDRLTTLRERFYREVMLLDTSIRTLNDVEARYGEEMVEVFGPPDTPHQHLKRGTILPVLGATFLLGFGWTLALLYPADAAAPLANALAAPNPSPVVWGFLGAYFIGIGMALRGHLRGDLDPKTFNSIIVRILLAIILAWSLDSVPHPDWWVVEREGLTAAGLAFLVGVFPDAWLTWLQERFRYRIPGLVETAPLTDLEGVDIYDRSRLAEEGINNVEALAHYDVIRLLLRTQIPPQRIIDWIDQAVLNIHTGAGDNHGKAGREPTVYEKLRRAGIRTATDLERAYHGRLELPLNEGSPPAVESEGKLERDHHARAYLEELVGGKGKLEVLMRAISDDVWLDHIRCRKLRAASLPRVVEAPDDFWPRDRPPPAHEAR